MIGFLRMYSRGFEEKNPMYVMYVCKNKIEYV